MRLFKLFAFFHSKITYIVASILLMAGLQKLGPYPSAKVHAELSRDLPKFFVDVWNFAPLNQVIKTGEQLQFVVGVSETVSAAGVLLLQVKASHERSTPVVQLPNHISPHAFLFNTRLLRVSGCSGSFWQS